MHNEDDITNQCMMRMHLSMCMRVCMYMRLCDTDSRSMIAINVASGSAYPLVGAQ